MGHSVAMLLGILIGLAVALLVGVAYAIFQRQRQPQLGQAFEQQAQKTLALMMQEIVKTTREQLGAEKRDISETIAKDLKLQTDTFKELTSSLKHEIEQRQREIRQLEEDRNQKYGQIAQALTDYKHLTEELRGSTEQLKRVLSSNQLRGSWGELQAEKILQAAGMVEGYHYAKQQPIAGLTELRPDFTLFLPNKLHVYVDVKFPLQALQLAMSTESKAEHERHIQQFGSDVKARIKEAGKYVTGRNDCVDYVILFVPSESVFEIINRYFPHLVDMSFSQQVILVSPHSFFAVVRTIQESHIHFRYEQNLHEILEHLQAMLQQFERFKGEFQDVGKALETAQTRFQQIATTRYKQIDKLTTKINSYHVDKPETPVLVLEDVVEEQVTE